MDKFFSFVDFIKSDNKTNNADKLLDDIYLDLFLNSIQHSQYEKHILALIDVALDEKNEVAFYQLTEQLKELQKIEEF